MATPAQKTANPIENKDTVRELARAIWKVEKTGEKDAAKLKESWNADKKNFIKLSRKIMRRLEKKGFHIAKK